MRADPDPASHSNADPDPTSRNNADPDQDTTDLKIAALYRGAENDYLPLNK